MFRSIQNSLQSRLCTIALWSSLWLSLGLSQSASAQARLFSPDGSARTLAWVAPAEEPPSSGVGKRVGGFVLVGMGVLNLGLIPVCFADFYPDSGREVCKVTSIAIGAVGLSVGVPLLIWGYAQRSERMKWNRAHGLARALQGVRVAARSGRAELSYRVEW